MNLPPWLVFAILSAVAASLVAVLGKIGMKGIDPGLATTVRSVVMTLFLLAWCTAAGLWSKVQTIHGKALGMIALSGLAGALSWLFYFKALQVGEASKVSPIDKLSVPLSVILAVMLLGERPTAVNWLGVGLMVAGGVMVAWTSNGVAN